jgi:transposase
VGRSTAYRWVAVARHEGRRTAKRMGGGPKPVIAGDVEAALLRLLKQNNHLTLAEYRDRLAAATGVRVHLWTVGRALRRLKWTWKKRTLRAAEQDRADVAAARAAWWTEAAGIGGIAPERLVFVDECGVLTSMARLYGRSRRGTRALGTVPCGHWTRLTVVGALGMEGIVAAMSVKAALNGATFAAYLDQVLLPALRRGKPDAVLVLDNLAAHKTTAVRALLDHSGFPYHYLPSYSPDLNPIELAWAKVKTDLRRVAARTTDALHQALGPALNAITAQHASGCFRHAGYIRPK